MKKNNLLLLGLCTTTFCTTYSVHLTALVASTRQEHTKKTAKKEQQEALEKVNLHETSDLSKALKKAGKNRFVFNFFKHLARLQEEVN